MRLVMKYYRFWSKEKVTCYFRDRLRRVSQQSLRHKDPLTLNRLVNVSLSISLQ